MVNLNSKIVFKINAIKNILWTFEFCFVLLNESLRTEKIVYYFGNVSTWKPEEKKKSGFKLNFDEKFRNA